MSDVTTEVAETTAEATAPAATTKGPKKGVARRKIDDLFDVIGASYFDMPGKEGEDIGFVTFRTAGGYKTGIVSSVDMTTMLYVGEASTVAASFVETLHAVLSASSGLNEEEELQKKLALVRARTKTAKEVMTSWKSFAGETSSEGDKKEAAAAT